MSREKIYLALAIGILCISSSSILVKEMAQGGVPLLAIAFYRMAATSILLGLPALFLRWEELRTRVSLRAGAILAGGIFLALHFGTWTLSLDYIPVARSVLLVNCHPIFTTIASRIFLKEKFSARNLLAVSIAFVGILVILAESISSLSTASQHSFYGDLLALAGAVTVVGYIIIGKKLRAEMSLLSYSATIYLVCAIFLLPVALKAGASLHNLSGHDYGLLLALAIIPTLGGHTVFNMLLKSVSATLISVAFLGEPLGASLLAWLRWGQVPSPFTIAGGLLVMLGIYLVQVKTNTEK